MDKVARRSLMEKLSLGIFEMANLLEIVTTLMVGQV